MKDVNIKNYDCHLGRVTLNNLKKWKDDIHQVDLSNDEVNTHAEVMLRSVRVAERLRSRSLRVGNQIVICGSNHNYMCLPILAAFYIGCSVFPFSITMTTTEIKRMFNLKMPKIIFCDPFMVETFTSALKELNVQVEIVVFGDVHSDSNSGHITPFSEFLKPTGTEDTFEVTNFDPYTTIAVTISSSGSTGLPKGVCHTHASFALATYFLSESDYRYHWSGFYMNFANYYWISAMWILLFTCLSGTPRLTCSLPYTVEFLKKGLTVYKPETLFLNPIVLYETIQGREFDQLDFSSVKSFLVGGVPISDFIFRAIKGKLINGKVSLAYGSSETSLISINNQGKIGTVGKPFPWMDWKVVDVNTGELVKHGVQGELCVKTKTLYKYYLSDEEATRDAFDSEGYHKTGDLFVYDEDGYLHFIDRVKEVMKYRYFQVTPTEIEVQIRTLPDVKQVCVVGIKHEVDGDLPVAFVQKSKESDLTEQDVKDIVKNNLADQKQLRGGVVFVDKIPLTGSGKIDRRTIKEMAHKLKAVD